MTGYVKLRSGDTLGRGIADYNDRRPHLRTRRFFRQRRLWSVCYAPFLTMDFDATGAIRLCNHSEVPLAHVNEETSIIDVWRGEIYRRYRQEMSNYVLDDKNCRHCIRQCDTGTGENVFAKEQFDTWAENDATPLYPKFLIFRLNNTCNLACVMCDGLTSSRIRRDRDKLPPIEPRYGERFFREMEEILPHVKHIEFYGGEPFLVKEHQRIFEILVKVKAKCSIYVNTNGVSLYPKAKKFLEELNFKTIAVSMDAVSADLHSEIRYGLRSDMLYKNLDYFLDLRARKGVYLMLNVTEHRKNWFELPEIFRFAERNQLRLHINTCLHPHNITLYTLPNDELRFVLTFLEKQRGALIYDYPEFRNLGSYDFLLDLIRTELASRGPEWQPVMLVKNETSDGLLATPIAGLPPFETAGKLLEEARRIDDELGGPTATRMLTEMSNRVHTLCPSPEWSEVARALESRVLRHRHFEAQPIYH